MTFRFSGFEWLDWVVEKLISKHNVEPEEVEQCFTNEPYKLRKAQDGKYYFYGQADSGRYLFVVFSWKEHYIRVITARDMTANERREFDRK